MLNEDTMFRVRILHEYRYVHAYFYCIQIVRQQVFFRVYMYICNSMLKQIVYEF